MVPGIRTALSPWSRAASSVDRTSPSGTGVQTAPRTNRSIPLTCGCMPSRRMSPREPSVRKPTRRADVVAVDGQLIKVRLSMGMRPPKRRRRNAQLRLAAGDDRADAGDANARALRQVGQDGHDSHIAFHSSADAQHRLAGDEPYRPPQADYRRSRREAGGSPVQGRAKPAEVAIISDLLPPARPRPARHGQLGRERPAADLDRMRARGERNLDRYPHRGGFRDGFAIDQNGRERGDSVEPQNSVDGRL